MNRHSIVVEAAAFQTRCVGHHAKGWSGWHIKPRLLRVFVLVDDLKAQRRPSQAGSRMIEACSPADH